MLVAKLLKDTIMIGTLMVVDSHGKTDRFEGTKGPVITVRLRDKSIR